MADMKSECGSKKLDRSTTENRMIHLCCEDNPKVLVKAKMRVLKKFSKYFDEILSLPVFENSEKEILLFLKQTPFKDLEILMDFMSNKELEIDEDSMESLMDTAKSLRIDEFLRSIQDEGQVSEKSTEVIPRQLKRDEKATLPESITHGENALAAPSVTVDVFKRNWFGSDQTENSTDSDVDCDKDSDRTLKIVPSLEDLEVMIKIDVDSSESDLSSVYFDCLDTLSTQKLSQESITQKSIDVDLESSCGAEDGENSTNRETSMAIENESKILEDVTCKESGNDTKHVLSLQANVVVSDAVDDNNKQGHLPSSSVETVVKSPLVLYLPALTSSQDASALSEKANLFHSTPTLAQFEYEPVKKKLKNSLVPHQKEDIASCNSSVNDRGERSQSYVCGICKKKFGWKQSARVHIRNQHPGKSPKDCIETIIA